MLIELKSLPELMALKPEPESCVPTNSCELTTLVCVAFGMAENAVFCTSSGDTNWL